MWTDTAPTGIEPVTPPWQGGVITTSPWSQINIQNADGEIRTLTPLALASKTNVSANSTTSTKSKRCYGTRTHLDGCVKHLHHESISWPDWTPTSIFLVMFFQSNSTSTCLQTCLLRNTNCRTWTYDFRLVKPTLSQLSYESKNWDEWTRTTAT